MFQYGVSAALQELPESQPVTLRGDIGAVCAQAAGIGYNAVELHIREPARYDPLSIRRVAEAHGLTICAVANGMEHTVGGLSLIDDDEARREAAVSRLLEHADLAAGLGAKLIVGIMRGNIPRGGDAGEYIARLSDAMARVCAYAAQRGVEVVLESILRYINNYLNSVPETMDYIESLGIPNLALHLDTHSMALEEPDLAGSIRYCAGKPLGYVHYSDNNRRYPGGGALDFRALTKALLQIGYKGVISLECLPWPDAAESARRGLAYMKAVETAARTELL
jgi:D-psicose/D-tagatose/L-ribulose 3-epimerase